MSTHRNHPYHLVDQSPWPIVGAGAAFVLVSGLVQWFHLYNVSLLVLGLIVILLVIIQWWRDVSREGAYQGLHTQVVTLGLRWGIVLFIVSEVLFFVSFFWAFFHRSLSPAIEIGIDWPPKGIRVFNPLQIPLLNTAVLLASGVTVTWAHHALMEHNYTQAFQGLFITVLLGVYFTILQGYEYIEAPFRIADSAYGSCFFIATGFHGLHVLIGTTFLGVCMYRLWINHFSRAHHFGFEAAAWYWHFVDVVWLFLYLSIYWWGSY
jgi:cytochrome c oxidase subunit 3